VIGISATRKNPRELSRGQGRTSLHVESRRLANCLVSIVISEVVIKKPAHADWLENIRRETPASHRRDWGTQLGLGTHERKLWRKKNVNPSQKAFIMPFSVGKTAGSPTPITVLNSGILSAQTKGETRKEVRRRTLSCACGFVWTSDTRHNSACGSFRRLNCSGLQNRGDSNYLLHRYLRLC